MVERIPDSVTEQERWIVKHQVDTVKVEHRQTGADTAETYVTLIAGKEKVTWRDHVFKKVARLDLSWATVASPNYGVAERVAAREAWERDNAKELAEYERLKAKFEAGDGR